MSEECDEHGGQLLVPGWIPSRALACPLPSYETAQAAGMDVAACYR